MRTMIGMLGILAMVTIPALAAAPISSETTDSDELIGLYKIVSAESNGTAIPDERIKDNTVRITPETIAVYDKDKSELYVARYQLNTQRDPSLIKMTQTGGPEESRGANAQGLIRVEGESVQLIYAVRGGELPTTFKTTKGAGQHLFVLQRTSE